jgi:outer membrane usher protein FimD/PapC
MALSLATTELAAPRDEQPAVDPLALEVATLKDQMSKVAVVLTQLSQASQEQRKQPAPSETQLSQINQLLQTMKVHVDSFPHALREARRSDIATQKAVVELAARLREVESRLGLSIPTAKTE